jgi:hypothetical protein
MPGGMCRNQFWLPHPRESTFSSAWGSKVVGVELSGWPLPQDPTMLAATLQLFDTCAGYRTPDAAR